MKRLLAVLLAGIMLIGGCVMAAPTVQTVEAEGVTNTEAILRGYCWGQGDGAMPYIIFRYQKTDHLEYPHNGDEWTEYKSALIGYYAHRITGLDPDSDYYFEFCGLDVANWNYGGEMLLHTRAGAPVGTAGHFWVEGDYWCYLDAAGYKRKIKGVG